MTPTMTHAIYAELLDSLGIAVCVFDDADRTVYWNTTFLRFFPEHDGHVFFGEPYADNLRRFYRVRLPVAEHEQIERYVEEGIARHRQQSRPYFFLHRGRQLQVASLATETGDRIRIWRTLARDDVPEQHPTATLTLDTLEYFPDGATVIDADNRIIAANREFRRLYDIPADVSVVGERLSQIVVRLWEASEDRDVNWRPTVRNNLRYSGVPFEILLPGGRWLRVIARQTADGTRYVTHSDITAMKRQYKELQEAEARARASERALQQVNEALAARADTDGLTHLANRGHFEARLQLEWKRASRDGTPISLLMIDIDHFKMVNDQFGHTIGDVCLRSVADIMRDAARRPTDVAARYGGEEFAVLLPSTGSDGALRVAQAIQAQVRAQNWSSINPAIRAITVSIGVYSCKNDGQSSMEDLVQAADALLYRAKHFGRDRIESASLTKPLSE